MIAVHLAPSVISLLLLGAHFYRADQHVLATLCGLLLGLVLIRAPWARRALQVALTIGALEWLRTAVALATARSAAGEPFLRLALILGGVLVFTAVAAILLQSRRATTYFRAGAL